MIVTTGATGALNGRTTEKLLEVLPADRIGVSVRDVTRAQSLAERGVRVRQGSYTDPAALRHSFQDAEQVLLVSTSDPHADGVALHRTGIDAARAVGARRVLYTSHQGAHPDTPFHPGRDHAGTEAVLAESGTAWTSLRNGFYAHSLDWFLGPWQRTGTIAAPADGPTSWTHREDAADAAAVLLSGTGVDGPVTLTAREAVTFEDIAAVLSELTGRTVRRVVVDDEEWVADSVAAGTPEPAARFVLSYFQAARAGFFAGTDPALGELLGREPRTVRDLLATRV